MATQFSHDKQPVLSEPGEPTPPNHYQCTGNKVLTQLSLFLLIRWLTSSELADRNGVRPGFISGRSGRTRTLAGPGLEPPCEACCWQSFGLSGLFTEAVPTVRKLEAESLRSTPWVSQKEIPRADARFGATFFSNRSHVLARWSETRGLETVQRRSRLRENLRSKDSDERDIRLNRASEIRVAWP
jgi:hypothetical protein